MSHPTTKQFNEAFELPEIIDVETSSTEMIPASEAEEETKELSTVSENKLEQDLDNVRTTQYQLIERGQESIDELISFAKASESPRAWEVVANLIKTTSEVANSLATISIENQKRKDNITKKEKSSSGNVTNNSIIFNGTTSELQKLLSGKKE